MGAFAIGVLPVAKTTEWRAFCESVIDGDNAASHRAYLRDHGVAKEHILLQPTPMGDLALIMWEGVDQQHMEKALGGLMAAPATEYEEFLVNTVVRDYHGIPADAPPPPPLERIATIEP